MARRSRSDTFFASEVGSTTLEFAIAVPVIVLLVFGSMITMLGLMAYGNATYATGIAARYAALHSNLSDAPTTSDAITSQVLSHLWLNNQQPQVTASWSAGNVPGSSVTVTTTLTVPLAIPLTDVTQLTITASSLRVITH